MGWALTAGCEISPPPCFPLDERAEGGRRAVRVYVVVGVVSHVKCLCLVMRSARAVLVLSLSTLVQRFHISSACVLYGWQDSKAAAFNKQPLEVGVCLCFESLLAAVQQLLGF
jgi:hypothetical protein